MMRCGMKRITLAILLVPLLVGGCTLGWTHFGHPLEFGAEAGLHEGQAKAEVLEQLGPPDRVEARYGESVFEYLYREQRDSELDLSFFQASFNYEQEWDRADRLVVRFDSKGRVLDYSIVRLAER